MEPAQALQELDLVVARVSAVAAHPGARGPSALLTLDLGGRGTRESPLPIALEEAEVLVGRQVVCALGGGDAVVLAVHPHDSPLVLLRPDREVEDGSPVA
jgi:tRNA-binding protein